MACGSAGFGWVCGERDEEAIFSCFYFFIFRSKIFSCSGVRLLLFLLRTEVVGGFVGASDLAVHHLGPLLGNSHLLLYFTPPPKVQIGKKKISKFLEEL